MMKYAASLVLFLTACSADPCPKQTQNVYGFTDGKTVTPPRTLPENADEVAKLVWREYLQMPDDSCPPQMQIILPTDTVFVSHQLTTTGTQMCLWFDNPDGCSDTGCTCATGRYEATDDVVYLLIDTVPGEKWYRWTLHEFNHRKLRLKNKADLGSTDPRLNRIALGDPYHEHESWQDVDSDVEVQRLLNCGL